MSSKTDLHPTPRDFLPLSAVDYHLLLVLADRDLYGYAILKAMESESAGAVTIEIGSLYRAIARLESAGLLGPAPRSETEPASPGRPRRYYRLTRLGREVLEEEVRRLQGALALAAERNLAAGDPGP